jgi:hypothetical protein
VHHAPHRREQRAHSDEDHAAQLYRHAPPKQLKISSHAADLAVQVARFPAPSQ